MAETEFPGVQHLARKVSGAFTAVEFIAENGMAEVMKVNPDLMGAAAVENAFDQADLAVGTQDPVFGFCGASLPPCDAHSLAMNRVAGDCFIDNAAVRPGQASHQG